MRTNLKCHKTWAGLCQLLVFDTFQLICLIPCHNFVYDSEIKQHLSSGSKKRIVSCCDECIASSLKDLINALYPLVSHWRDWCRLNCFPDQMMHCCQSQSWADLPSLSGSVSLWLCCVAFSEIKNFREKQYFHPERNRENNRVYKNLCIWVWSVLRNFHSQYKVKALLSLQPLHGIMFSYLCVRANWL